MDNIKTFCNYINESMETYNPEKLYSYNFVVQHLKRGPMYMQKLISTLKPVKGTNTKGEEVMKTKITNKIFAFIYHKAW